MNIDLPVVSSAVPWGNKVFNCIVAGVNHIINDAIASNTQKFDKFEGSSINECSDGQMDGVKGRTNLQRHDDLQQGSCSLGVSRMGCFTVLCKVAK